MSVFLYLHYFLTSLISSKHYSVGHYKQLIKIIYNQIKTKHWGIKLLLQGHIYICYPM